MLILDEIYFCFLSRVLQYDGGILKKFGICQFFFVSLQDIVGTLIMNINLCLHILKEKSAN